MKTSALRVLILIAALGLIFLAQPQPQRAYSGPINLQPPPLAPGYIENKAGIAAYIQAPAPLNLALIHPMLKTIALDGDSYVIGTYALPSYPDYEDVHIYASADGWIMAYYPRTHFTGILFDWPAGLSSNRLAHALGDFASALGLPAPDPAYYHFQYPDATTLLLISKTSTVSTSFTVLPPSGLQYYEFGLNLTSHTGCLCTPRGSASYMVDGVPLIDHGCGDIPDWGKLPTPLAVDQQHTISLNVACGTFYGGLTVLYSPAGIVQVDGAGSQQTIELAISPGLRAALDQIPPYVIVSGAMYTTPLALESPQINFPDLFFSYLPITRR